MSGDDGLLSTTGEQRIRDAFAGDAVLQATALIDRLIRLNNGLVHRGSACSLISTAFFAGLLVRTGLRRGYTYTLVRDWVRPATRPTVLGNPRDKDVRRDVAQAAAYTGPAFTRDQLAPSLGVVCGETQEEREGELPPWLGGQIVDSLHRGFRDVFGSVE